MVFVDRLIYRSYNYMYLIWEIVMKTVLKILLIGFITTIFRIIGQVLIPESETSQTALLPSVFVKNGTLPLVFSLYGFFAYSLIVSMFLLIRNQLSGNKISQGLQYGLSCCAVWIIYLLEPLPHVTTLFERIIYPIVDSLAFLVMGVLLGLILGENSPFIKKKEENNIIPLLSITSCFVVGRLLQYNVFDIYSSFHSNTIETIVWMILTGLVVASVLIWLNRYIVQSNYIKRALILGCLLFGLDLTLFNFFIPLVFTYNIPDMILRTIIDFSAVTIGCLAFRKTKVI